jgi:HEAT repeats
MPGNSTFTWRLNDLLARATQRVIVFGNDTVWESPPPDEKLIAYVQMNVDIWTMAREQLFVGGHTHIQHLAQALSVGDIEVRRVISKILRATGSKKSMAILVSALGDSDVFVRDEAILALSSNADQELTLEFAVAFAGEHPSLNS